MGYRANEQGNLSEDFVAAGNGVTAFGVVFILPVQIPVQTHQEAGRVSAVQWIYEKQRHVLMDQEADKQEHQIQR